MTMTDTERGTPKSFRDLPGAAAWRHQGARDGFEAAFLRSDGRGFRIEGATTAVEEGRAFSVRYAIVLDSGWLTRSAVVRGRSATGAYELSLEGDGGGRWRVNGAPAPDLEGCFDIDLESSALTNAFPVHRLALGIGEAAEAPAAYVRALDLGVEWLEQSYLRLGDEGDHQRYHYRSPGFGFECELAYDQSGLVVDYPGIAVRVPLGEG